MKSNVSISIIMPAFNTSQTIEDTIESVIAQTYQNWELIIVDDASTDNTVDVISRYTVLDSRIRLITLEKNFGAPAGPRNKGVANSNFDWIAFIDSDDLWHREKLKQQVIAISENEIEFISTQIIRFKDTKDFEAEKQLIKKPLSKKISFLKQLLRYSTPTSSVLVKKSIITSFPFEEGIAWRAREDLDCWLRIHRAIGHSIKLDFPLVGYRVIDGQISGNKIQMISRTYYCYTNSKGVPKTPFGVFAIFLTALHLAGGLLNRLIGDTL
jgi:teichuronic acid biosynthesis glycosyltransferase TuaG